MRKLIIALAMLGTLQLHACEHCFNWVRDAYNLADQRYEEYNEEGNTKVAERYLAQRLAYAMVLITMQKKHAELRGEAHVAESD